MCNGHRHALSFMSTSEQLATIVRVALARSGQNQRQVANSLGVSYRAFNLGVLMLSKERVGSSALCPLRCIQ